VGARVAKLVADRAVGGQIHLLSLRTTVLGRNSRCDLILDEEGVSRRHARIVERRGRYFLSDLGSMNGTYVDDRPLPIHGQAELVDGAVVRIGRMVLRFVVSDDPGPAPEGPPGAPPASGAPAALHAHPGRRHAGRRSRRGPPQRARDLP
jgi:predicted component of type VI protein secretion system